MGARTMSEGVILTSWFASIYVLLGPTSIYCFRPLWADETSGDR